jgi:hypothetical protein
MTSPFREADDADFVDLDETRPSRRHARRLEWPVEIPPWTALDVKMRLALELPLLPHHPHPPPPGYVSDAVREGAARVASLFRLGGLPTWLASDCPVLQVILAREPSQRLKDAVLRDLLVLRCHGRWDAAERSQLWTALPVREVMVRPSRDGPFWLAETVPNLRRAGLVFEYFQSLPARYAPNLSVWHGQERG